MQEVVNKYLWDGKENLSTEFIFRRMLEYAAFPDLLKLSYEDLKNYVLHINPDKLRTSEKRKEFIRVIRPYLKTADSIEAAVFQLINNYFE